MLVFYIITIIDTLNSIALVDSLTNRYTQDGMFRSSVKNSLNAFSSLWPELQYKSGMRLDSPYSLFNKYQTDKGLILLPFVTLTPLLASAGELYTMLLEHHWILKAGEVILHDTAGSTGRYLAYKEVDWIIKSSTKISDIHRYFANYKSMVYANSEWVQLETAQLLKSLHPEWGSLGTLEREELISRINEMNSSIEQETTTTNPKQIHLKGYLFEQVYEFNRILNQLKRHTRIINEPPKPPKAWPTYTYDPKDDVDVDVDEVLDYIQERQKQRIKNHQEFIKFRARKDYWEVEEAKKEEVRVNKERTLYRTVIKTIHKVNLDKANASSINARPTKALSEGNSNLRFNKKRTLFYTAAKTIHKVNQDKATEVVFKEVFPKKKK